MSKVSRLFIDVIGAWVFIPILGVAINSTMIQRIWIEDQTINIEDASEVYEIECPSQKDAFRALTDLLKAIKREWQSNESPMRVQLCDRFGSPIKYK